MATTRTVQRPTAAGATATLAACDAAGDNFVNTGREYVSIFNGDAAPHTVTVSSGANACSFGTANVAHDLTVVVAAGEQKLIGPFAPGQFNDATSRVNLAYTAVTDMTIGIFSTV